MDENCRKGTAMSAGAIRNSRFFVKVSLCVLEVTNEYTVRVHGEKFTLQQVIPPWTQKEVD